MLQYMKAFLAEEERRKQLGLPSQVPRQTTDGNEVATSTEEESSDEEPPRKSAKTSSTFQAINIASMAHGLRCTAWFAECPPILCA